MNIYKKRKPFISLVCVFSLLLSLVCIPVAAADTNSVTATTNATVKQGGSGTCYVYIDSTAGLAALDVTVRFDPAKVKVSSVYNSVSCTLYDNVKNTDSVQFTYILDGKGTASKTRLFYFYYQVLSGAEVGNAYFDITVGEAYDNSLNDVTVFGSRCSFTITETVTTKTCTVSSTSTVSTGIEKEFSLSYRFSTYKIASGSVVINYDPELFAVTEVTNGNFLDNKVTDVNTQLQGAVYVSFAGTAYKTKYDLITVKFKTLKNVNETSKITFKATELCDLELNPISCKDYVTTVNVGFDDSYIGDAPVMRVSANYNAEQGTVSAVITLEADSHLGAGDFTLAFDPSVLSLDSYAKGFAPSFFNINDKDVANGVFKFYIISLEDVVTEEKVITFTFDVLSGCTEQTTAFDLSGNVLTDALTNSIQLNILDDSIVLPERHSFVNGSCYRCDKTVGEAPGAESSFRVGRVVLRSEACGIYFKGNFELDTDLQAVRYGIALSVSNPAPVADNTDMTSLYTLGSNSVLVKDIFSQNNSVAQNKENGRMTIYARAYVLLSDGTYVYSDTVSVCLQQVVMAADAMWDSLSQKQKDALLAFYSEFESVMKYWDIPSVKA